MLGMCSWIHQNDLVPIETAHLNSSFVVDHSYCMNVFAEEKAAVEIATLGSAYLKHYTLCQNPFSTTSSEPP